MWVKTSPMAAKVEPPTCLRRLPNAGPAHRSALTHGRGAGSGGGGGGGGHATRRHQWSTGCSLARRPQAPETVIYLIQGKSMFGHVSLGSGCCSRCFVVLCFDFTHKSEICARCSHTHTHTHATIHTQVHITSPPPHRDWHNLCLSVCVCLCPSLSLSLSHTHTHTLISTSISVVA